MKIKLDKPDISPSEDDECGSNNDEPLAKQRKAIQAKEEKWLSNIRMIFLCLAVSITTIVLIVYFWHLCAPECVRWLDNTDLIKIKDLATTIIVGLILSISTTFFFKK